VPSSLRPPAEDPVSISEHQYQGILRVIECLGNGLDSRETRELAGVELLKLLRADYFASFIWNPDQRRFAGHVFINMDPQNLERYSSYYQFHNPLTAKVQKVRRAVRVNEILPQRELVRTEFYNDFLAHDGLHYGLNLYVHDGDVNIGDMRIWRNRRRENFDDCDLQMLEMIKPHFCNSMKNALRLCRIEDPKVSGGIELIESDRLNIERIRSAYGLTIREAQIAVEIAYGKTDHEIAEAIGIAFSTIRTHLNHVYEKLGIRNRAALVHLICA
jgi:DNA-binding CsgD family transcriptional regulator